MNNQKDTQKTKLNSYGHTNSTGIKALSNKPVYEFINKKTEKLVTALYMVSDYMESQESLRSKLRLLGVELMSDIFTLSRLSPLNNSSQIDLSLSRIYEIFSFIEIAETMGYISTMNKEILKTEFNILVEELKSRQSQKRHLPFNLNKNMFEIERNDFVKEKYSDDVFYIKDKNKRTHSVSFMKGMSDRKSIPGHSLTAVEYKKVKQERIEKILSIIKNKETSPTGEEGATVKDISTSFPNCSVKTIQRELLVLIDKGQIKKIGAKRWSRYQFTKVD